MKYLTFIFLISLNAGASCPSPATALIGSAKQLILVTADNWTNKNAKIQVFARSAQADPWSKLGATQAAMIGEKGMGYGVEYKTLAHVNPLKREGDGRTPAG